MPYSNDFDLDDIANSLERSQAIIVLLAHFLQELSDEREAGLPARNHPIVHKFIRDISERMQS